MNLEASTEAETREEGMLLNCLLYMACTATFLIHPRPTCLSMASSAVGWATMYQVFIKRLFHRHAQRPTQWRQFLDVPI